MERPQEVPTTVMPIEIYHQEEHQPLVAMVVTKAQVSSEHCSKATLRQRSEKLQRARDLESGGATAEQMSHKVSHRRHSQELKELMMEGAIQIKQGEMLDLIPARTQLDKTSKTEKRSNRKVAISALESLVKYSSDVQQILTCFRCLTRLRLTLSGESPDPLVEANAVATYLESVLVQLNGIAVKEPMSAGEKDMLTNEASWFMKVAWNMAIEHSAVSRLTHLFFAKCSQFCELLSNDTSNLGRQKTCLVMAAAASLQMAREAHEDDEKRASLEKVLEHVYSCQNVCSQLHDVGSGDGEKRDRAYSMLLLYEFEALAKLGRSSELDGLVKQVLSSPSYDTKTIETLAVLVMEPPAHYKQLSKKLLHAAIDKHMNSNNIDIETCSKTLHSAIRLCLGEGGGSESTGREEAWHLYQLAIRLLQSEKKDSYPEMEILWLMTKAWNTGIYSFSSGQYSLADAWCTMGMDLMTHLTALKVNYEEKMKSLFAEIQAKISSLKLKDSLEE